MPIDPTARASRPASIETLRPRLGKRATNGAGARPAPRPMRDGVARIAVDGGALIVSAETPYERALLVEHVEAYTRRHGRVRLIFNRGESDITPGAGHPWLCTSCGRRLDKLAYWLSRKTVCDWCARRAQRR